MFNLFRRKKVKYEFQEPEATACFVCRHVLHMKRPILYVAHDSDGDWQFLCGHNYHSDDDVKIISLKEITKIDPSVNDLYEMPLKVGAERETVTHRWKPFKLPDS